MHLKSLLLASLLIGSLTAVAQQQSLDFTMKTGQRVIKTDTKKDTTARSRMERPLLSETRKENIQVKQGKYKPVPLAGHKSYFGDMNDYMMGYCKTYMEAHNQTLCAVRSRSTNQFPLIDNILRQHDIPKELKYLAVIESALNNKAVSPVGAVGPWQFMEVTGREMGLTINGRRDDRTDWHKSTVAAVKYLSILYSKLNDWLLVVAAYNSGPVPVERAIAITGSHNFWDIKKYLPRETQGHVMAFVATATIFECLGKYINIGVVPNDFKFTDDPYANLPKMADAKKGNTPSSEMVIQKPVFTKEELSNMVIVRISQPLSFELLTKELEVDKKQMDRWNFDYELFIYNTYPTEYYSLRIPKDKLDMFVQKKESLEKQSKVYFDQISM
jgi:membrane-bound lytic murein transglycosylase D